MSWCGWIWNGTASLSHKGRRSVTKCKTLQGFFWRIRHQHGAAQVLVVALPERLEQKNQSEFEREVVNCSEALRQSGKRLVVVMADEGSQLFHRLAHLRKTDLELEAKALEYEELQRCCPFLDEASLIRGEPLSGKPREILGVQNRIALWSGLSELEFCRLCRNICREGQAPQLLIDFGWTDLDGKQSWAWYCSRCSSSGLQGRAWCTLSAYGLRGSTTSSSSSSF